MKNKTILLISPEAWGTNFVSKHHYANYLSKNNTVYFLNPVLSSSVNPFGTVKASIDKIKDNLFQVNYQNLIPKLNNLPKLIQAFIYKKQAKQIQKTLGVTKFDIVWSFDPFRFWNQKVWLAEKYVYHTVDVHFNKCFEEYIADTSNIVLLSSELLRDKLKKSNKNIFYTGHAADIDNFEKASEQINLLGENNLKSGLVGNFNSNVDYNLIRKIAKINSHIDFIFIGPYANNNLSKKNDSTEIITELQQLDNVFFVGEIKSNEIINWLKSFDINLVLYKESKRDIIINPHKMMGYFYSGSITVCSWFNEYKNAPKELVYVSKSNDEIPQIIKDVSMKIDYWNSKDFKAKRKQFALQNSYDKKIEEISKLIYK